VKGRATEPAARTRRPPIKPPAAVALKKVRAALRRVRPELARVKISPRASLVGDLSIDSLALAQLAMNLEEEFGRPIFLGDVLSEVEDPTAITVGELAEFVSRVE
jgi:acyl carrier protein